ncbi:MAG: 2-oxoacid:acceptor oxidoreductase family protein [Candidatus Thorarchaeota archaeon]|nr:2-oxoacid:acceptor oxidoreductase family protein [Candidatus Thorarchaeota archaeon]
MDEQPFNIVITGVGGQGNLVTSRVLARAAIADGLSPTIGQTFGASQRGGAVTTHIRLADQQVAPLVPKGALHVLLGLEPLEGLRAAIDFAGANTIAIVSDLKVDTLDTLAGTIKYPELDDIFSHLAGICGTTYRVPIQTNDLASRSLNAYLVGIMVGLEVQPISQRSIRQSYESMGKRTTENLNAFATGIDAVKDLRPI